jgi:hypothetical protein
MKLFTLLLAAVLLSNISYTQITKHKWLLGGQVSFDHTKSKTELTQSSSAVFQLKPQLGYFAIDKLAG